METRELLIQALRTGVKEYERARKEHPSGPLDLSGADLSHCNLQFVQMGRANLQDVNFQHADLTGANLSHADLRRANFKDARIFGVNLHKALLEGAEFQGSVFGDMDRGGRMCINVDMFKGVHWGKEQLEYFLSILNQNERWEIRYQVLPREPQG